MHYAYQDLFDIERRPGAGVSLWTQAVEHQLKRVREVNYRHRLHHSPSIEEKREDPDAEWQLHAELYFLVLAIRRALLFHDALAKQVNDSRLREARGKFIAEAPRAAEFRNFYEHLDQYLLDDPRKHVAIPGRAAPVLTCRWDCDNVVVAFGSLRMDVTLAALAAIELGKTSSLVWDQHLERVKAEEPAADLPESDDGIPRRMELTLGVSTVIEGEDESAPCVRTGTLLGVGVREATPEEIADADISPAGPER